VLRYFVDLPVSEVADAMQIKEGTVKALTHQAIANLRRALDLRELGEVSHGK
jgi:DNA-directed RNA polymerase specialized sigma24 family protein